MGKRAKVARAVILSQPGQLKSWPGIVGIHADEQEPFVIPKADVVFGPEFLDQPPLEEHGFGFAADDVPLELPDAVDECARFGVGGGLARRRKVVRKPLSQVARLADIDHPLQAISHHVDPWLVRHIAKSGLHVFGHAETVPRSKQTSMENFSGQTRSGHWLGLRRGWKALFYRDSMKIVLTGLASLALSPTLLAQSAEPTPAAEFMKRANLWQVLQAGGPAMIPLGILSVITLMLVIAFLFSMRRGSIVTKRFMQTADALIRKRDFLGLLAVSNRHNEAIARVVQRMMNFLTKNPKATIAEIREIAQTEGIRQASALNQRVAYLADIGTIAPMVGLLGTVIGIVRSFGVIAIDAAATRPTMLAQGIGEALIATAAGLLIGIPAMAAYAFFRGRVPRSHF